MENNVILKSSMFNFMGTATNYKGYYKVPWNENLVPYFSFNESLKVIITLANDCEIARYDALKNVFEIQFKGMPNIFKFEATMVYEGKTLYAFDTRKFLLKEGV